MEYTSLTLSPHRSFKPGERNVETRAAGDYEGIWEQKGRGAGSPCPRLVSAPTKGRSKRSRFGGA